MGRWLPERLLRLALVLFSISFLSFGLMRLAGSDVVEQKMENRGEAVSAKVAAEARASLGLDQPFLVQYSVWLKRAAGGDLGRSYVSGQPVAEAFWQRLPNTLRLAFMSVLLTVVLSLPLGILSAVRQNGPVDYAVRVLSFVGNSLPNFVVALLLLYILSLRLGWLPVISDGTDWESAVMPGLTLAIAMGAKYIRQVRTAVLEELSHPYVAGALSRGIPFARLLWGGVLRSAGGTLLTLLALSLGDLMGGAAVVETIFMYDGVGSMAAEAIRMRDYPVVQAYVMMMGGIYALLNLLADLGCRWLDPRIGRGDA